jgi:predicted nucleic acid-binding protein
MLCDSNILIYAADPADTCCAGFAEDATAAVASISRIEVLGFPGFASLAAERATRLTEVVRSMVELPLTESIIQRAIVLRQARKMSLADAVIAATALVHSMPLVTRNIDDFKHIQGLHLIDPFAPARSPTNSE